MNLDSKTEGVYHIYPGSKANPKTPLTYNEPQIAHWRRAVISRLARKCEAKMPMSSFQLL